MNQFRLAVVGGAIAASFFAFPVSAQLITRHDLPADVAVDLAKAAIASCKAQGYAVTAVIVDRAGITQVSIRDDNAAAHTMENARRKAYTALVFKTPTTATAKRFADNDPLLRQQLTLPNMIAIPGGVPIKVGNDVIAAIGVSGSPGVDEGCVLAGLDAVAGRLK